MTPEPTKLTYYVLYDEVDDVYYTSTLPMHSDNIGGMEQFIVYSRFPFEATKFIDLKILFRLQRDLKRSATSDQAELAHRFQVRKMTVTYDIEDSVIFDVLGELEGVNED